MKRIEIEVLKPEDALNAFKAAWKKAEKGNKVTPPVGFWQLKRIIFCNY